MRSHLHRFVLPALLALPALTACSDAAAGGGTDTGEEASTAAWRAQVEEALGATTVDLEALMRQAAADCRRTSAAAWVPTLVMSGDLSTSATDVTRIGLVHACPEVTAAFDEAVSTVERAPEPLGLVCGPDVVLEGDDALKAEMVCASR